MPGYFASKPGKPFSAKRLWKGNLFAPYGYDLLEEPRQHRPADEKLPPPKKPRPLSCRRFSPFPTDWPENVRYGYTKRGAIRKKPPKAAYDSDKDIW